MAESLTGLSLKHLEESVTTTPMAALPRRLEAKDNMPVPCGVEDGANKANSEARDSTGEDVPDLHEAHMDDPAVADAVVSVGEQVTATKKKKKSKRIPKSRKNITGFEEYYADAPMTPLQAAEKKKLYDPMRPFSERIEECIQRFRARRRLDSQRMTLFNKYLFLGGIDTSQRQFTGMALDREAMVEADSEQIRTMTAVDFVGGQGNRFYDPSRSEDWEVDFEAVVEGYLSRTIPDWCMYDPKIIQTAADVVKNFLNYVLMQDVCPEYTANIVAARHVCDIAPIEFRYIHELTFELPGHFNCAARSLFCEGQINHLDREENSEAFVQFKLTTLVWSSSDKAKLVKQKILNTADPTTIKVISTASKTYQVLEMARPLQKDKKMVEKKLAELEAKSKVKPAGIISVAPAIIAHGWGNMPRPEEVDFSNAETEEFFLEDELLGKFEIGMKIAMTVCELNIGLRFIKEVHDLRVSFDTFLPQYLMANWKEPIPNTRPPPSIHDPNAEEKAMGAEMHVDE
ncbi:Argonaute siRNA chaperone complex subunit Arb1-domain-containing protein [Xylaria bambusicola]|uniref:Argonaute siRNA chaperone complex subunit Arb1-domain-containing protein n=1 Tax=Xylaria bambusicola TaxID=326684 RepID=UPI002007A2FA|nr:Argonaute siRNA chaperone complex subunit Arb1-domain-containing protein [Xylaria bambusicola]KAI0525866.1 Argonaute siRNA chaperone complex subunit Arb1-domain-containing protein [Xylaria bambusicola]